MGVPVVAAPSEGEAQCAELSRKGVVHCVATTDTDALVFGAKKVVFNIFKVLKGEPAEEVELSKCLEGDFKK